MNEIKLSPEEHKQALRSAIIRLRERTAPTLDTSLQGYLLAGMSILLEEQPNFFNDVVDFHYKFGIQYQGPPRMLPNEDSLREFRDERLKEEMSEYFEAITLEEKIDALADLIYIALGTAHLHGFARFNEAWKRVHGKNMEKELSSSENPGKYGILGDKRDIVKPPGWTPPDHRDLVYHLQCVKCGNYDAGDKCHNCGGELIDHEKISKEIGGTYTA